jgi:hypothetical protein
MATDLPRIQGYVPQAIYDALKTYRDANNLKSNSIAVTYVLANFFGISLNSDLPVNQERESLTTRVKVLEGKSLTWADS